MSKIKICGMQRIEDIEIINTFSPDYTGFIMSTQQKFRRQIPVDRAKEFKAVLNPGIKAVGVFVNEPVEFVASICREDIIDLIQLHGNEDEEYIKSLLHLNKPVIKAVHVNSTEQIEKAVKLSCDYLLLDTAYKDKVGGGGVKFNWDLIPTNLQKPYFLAGGLSSENIIPAINTLNPYCVDLSSSVETNGFKDKAKIKEIIELVRSV